MSSSALNRLFLGQAVIGGTAIALALGIVFLFFPNYWQLVVLAGLAAGLIVKSWWKGFTVGFLGVLLSWVVYVAYLSMFFPVWQLVSVLGDIVGLPGSVLVGLAMLVGSLFGGLGAVMGVALRGLIGIISETKNLLPEQSGHS